MKNARKRAEKYANSEKVINVQTKESDKRRHNVSCMHV